MSHASEGHLAVTNADDRGPDEQRKSPRLLKIIRVSSFIVIVASLVVIGQSLPVENSVATFRAWLSDLGAWGGIAMGIVYVIATVLFVPGTILTLVSGAVFGLGWGMLIVSISSTIGASLAFLISRYLMRERVVRFAARHPRFQVIDRAVGEGGWKIVALLRLSPVLPFNLQNYLYGITPIGFWPYALTSWIAMMPGTFLYVYLGQLSGAALVSPRQRGLLEWVLLVVGLLATIMVTIYITRLAQAKLRERVSSPLVFACDDV